MITPFLVGVIMCDICSGGPTAWTHYSCIILLAISVRAWINEAM